MEVFDLRQWSGFQMAGGDPNTPAIIDQITIDSRRIYSARSLFVALAGDKNDGHDFIQQAAQAGARYALVNKNWNGSSSSITLLRVEDPLKSFQEICRAYRLSLNVKVIAITGSFGKTMVKDLLHSMLNKKFSTAASPESFNSQIGVPLSLLTIKKENQIAIIEAAFSQKDEVNSLVHTIAPDFGILTPIGNKHLLTLDDLSTLASETAKMLMCIPSGNWKLVPQDPLITDFHAHISPPLYYWNEPDPHLPHAYCTQSDTSSPFHYRIVFPDGEIFESQFSSGHSYTLNLINMAIKAAWLLGSPPSDIKATLNAFKPEPMRTEIWKSSTGATFINDTYCSDPLSIDRSLQYFDLATPNQLKIFVFGGMRGESEHHHNDYQRIGKSLAACSLHSLILFGEKNFKPLTDVLSETHPTPEITVCNDFLEAMQFLKTTLHPDSLVLVKGDNKHSLDLLTEVFNDSINNNQCLINLAAIQSNILSIRKHLPNQTRIMTMVKALAYGTDDIRISKFLASCGIDIFGVSYVDEGVSLKRAGVQQTIFVINAAPYEALKVAKWDLEVGISDRELVQALSKEACIQKKNIKVHLHVNTGMGRFGCRPEEALGIAELVKSLPGLSLEGIMTHFSSADEPSQDAYTLGQVEVFDRVIKELQDHGIDPPWKHAANSSGALRFSLPQYNMVRIGLAIYGLYNSELSKTSLDLRLSLSLTSRIVGINRCKQGESISYGRSYQVEREEQRIAVLPIGYFDGLHRNYSGKCHVLIRGKKAPMVGKICMDHMMVDVTDIPNATVGDKVLIFGEDEMGQYLSPEELASCGNSITHELITCLGPRIQRIFVFEESKQIR